MFMRKEEGGEKIKGERVIMEMEVAVVIKDEEG